MSIASRVVPAMSETITTSLLANAFNKLDFPAFGFPIITILKPSLNLSPILSLWRCFLISLLSLNTVLLIFIIVSSGISSSGKSIYASK